MVGELDRIVKQEYEELGDLINTIEACSEDIEDVVKQGKESARTNVVAEMGKVVK